MDQVEVSGKTVEDALDAALRQLGATVDEVEFIVLDEGRRGLLFGAGARDARVRVQRTSTSSAPRTGAPRQQQPEDQGRRRRGGRGRAGEGGGQRQRQPGRTGGRRSYEEPVPELTEDHFRRRDEFPEAAEEQQPEQARPPGRSQRRDSEPSRQRRRSSAPEVVVEPNIDHELVDLAATVVDDVLRILDVDAGINLREPITAGDGLGSALAVIDIDGEDLGALIGRRGDTLLHLQYLVNLIVSRRFPDQGGVTIDIAHYRHRREEQLVDLANRMADRVRENGSPITLEPMSAADRRLVHLTLADDPEVETHSTGDGESRKVVISPRR